MLRCSWSQLEYMKRGTEKIPKNHIFILFYKFCASSIIEYFFFILFWQCWNVYINNTSKALPCYQVYSTSYFFIICIYPRIKLYFTLFCYFQQIVRFIGTSPTCFHIVLFITQRGIHYCSIIYWDESKYDSWNDTYYT